MWTSPSTPGSSCTKAPNGASRTTLAVTMESTGYLCSTVSHGFGKTCFKPREIFSFSRSIRKTMTSISSLTLTTSEGWLIRCQDISEICKSPSTPPISTKAPKLVSRRTIPFTTWFSCRFSIISWRNLTYSSSSNALRDRITFFLPRFISITLQVIVWPRYFVRSST
ncbi:MAG: hypothetical protein BWY65_01220 [Firmicutes bacterium ADurb.Bin373]|nr:MAG: hypothetical protein BWY65_01220 [Firmicutes bacterium ADurb.Bin373]